MSDDRMNSALRGSGIRTCIARVQRGVTSSSRRVAVGELTGGYSIRGKASSAQGGSSNGTWCKNRWGATTQHDAYGCSEPKAFAFEIEN